MIPFYITAHHAFLIPAGTDLRPALKAHCIDGRRMTRFSQLALLGAAPLGGEHLYLGSSFHSPATFLRTFDNLLAHNLPSPLDFMANLHNAAAFQVAKYLDISGTSLFMAVDGETVWQPLWLGINELLAHPRDRVLVGWAWEAPPGNAEAEEGSIWWCLSGDAPQNDSFPPPAGHSPLRVVLEVASDSPLSAPVADQSILQAVANIHAQLKTHACVHLPALGYPVKFSIQLHG